MKKILNLFMIVIFLSGCMGGVDKPMRTADRETVAEKSNRIVSNDIIFEIYVPDENEAKENIKQKVAELEGVSSTETDSHIVIYVPNLRLAELGEYIHDIAYVDDFEKKMTDATDEYELVLADMKILRESRDKYKKVLDKSSNADTSLLIQKEITRVDSLLVEKEQRIKQLTQRNELTRVKITFNTRDSELASEKRFTPVSTLESRTALAISLIVIALAYM